MPQPHAEPVAPPAPSPAPSPGRAPRKLAAAFWFGLMPALAALATMRWLVPAPSDIGVGAWGWLAELGAGYPMPMAIGLFLLFGWLVRSWRDRLPFGNLLAPAPEAAPARTLPQRITSIAAIVLVALAALTLRGKAAQLYEVKGASMLPTLLPGDTLVVSKLGRQSPRRGDLVAFRTGRQQPAAAGVATASATPERLVKRVIGLPGDQVSTRAGVPVINGWEVPNCDAGTYVRHAANGTVVGRLLVEFLEDRTFLSVHVPGTQSFPAYVVKPGEVYVLGDDRSRSEDSRVWNAGRGAGVPLAAMEGRPWRVIGVDVNGRLDLGRLLERPGLSLHMPGMDIAALEAGVKRCIEARPKETWPPTPRLESSGP